MGRYVNCPRKITQVNGGSQHLIERSAKKRAPQSVVKATHASHHWRGAGAITQVQGKH